LSYDPTPNQALLIFGLLAAHGSAAQAALMPAVKKADREALADARLITVDRAGRGFHLTLADGGWAWTAAHLSAELPPAQRALSNLLIRLGEHLANTGETLADFIGSKPEEAAPPEPQPKPARKKAKAKSPSPAAVRKRIEKAYLTITRDRKDQGVSLTRLRAELSDLDRATMDAALGRILRGDKKASLMRNDDPRQLSQADHDDAFNPAGEPFHVIWIAS
jgi:hypothetical protein